MRPCLPWSGWLHYWRPPPNAHAVLSPSAPGLRLVGLMLFMLPIGLMLPIGCKQMLGSILLMSICLILALPIYLFGLARLNTYPRDRVL